MSEIKKEDKPSFQEENMMIEPVEERRVAISFQANPIVLENYLLYLIIILK